MARRAYTKDGGVKIDGSLSEDIINACSRERTSEPHLSELKWKLEVTDDNRTLCRWKMLPIEKVLHSFFVLLKKFPAPGMTGNNYWSHNLKKKKNC